jgi:hypothetical protein
MMEQQGRFRIFPGESLPGKYKVLIFSFSKPGRSGCHGYFITVGSSHFGTAETV